MICFVVLLTTISFNFVSGNPFGTLGQGRIVGGVEATPHEFPYIVELRRGTHYCAGSIINPHYILTAAHCLRNGPIHWRVIAGDHNIDAIEGNEQNKESIDTHYPEPFASDQPLLNDIALVRVYPPFVFNQYVKPVRLPEPSDLVPDVATTAGWGRLTAEGSISSVLMKLDVPHVNKSACAAAHSSNIPSSVICYGGEAGKGYCFGDGGGPLVDRQSNTLFGVASEILGPEYCGNPAYHQLYTEVSQYLPWIRDVGFPTAEDTEPVSTFNTCGGNIDTSSGRISISNLVAGQKCMWTMKSSLDFIRVTLTDAIWFNVDKLYITQLLGGVPDEHTRISQTGSNQTIYLGTTDTIVLITLIISPDFPNALRSINLDLFSSGFPTTDVFITKFISLSTTNQGEFSYPLNSSEYDYTAVFTLTAPDGRNKALTFTQLDLDDGPITCIRDALIIHGLEEEEYKPIEMLCGNTLPPSPFHLPGGIGLLTYISSHMSTGTGFGFKWDQEGGVQIK